MADIQLKAIDFRGSTLYICLIPQGHLSHSVNVRHKLSGSLASQSCSALWSLWPFDQFVWLALPIEIYWLKRQYFNYIYVLYHRVNSFCVVWLFEEGNGKSPQALFSNLSGGASSPAYLVPLLGLFRQNILGETQKNSGRNPTKFKTQIAEELVQLLGLFRQTYFGWKYRVKSKTN